MQGSSVVAAVALTLVGTESAHACISIIPSMVAAAAGATFHTPLVLGLLALAFLFGVTGSHKTRKLRRRSAVAVAGLYAMLVALAFLSVLAIDLATIAVSDLGFAQFSHGLLRFNFIFMGLAMIAPLIAILVVHLRRADPKVAALIHEAGRGWWVAPFGAGASIASIVFLGWWRSPWPCFAAMLLLVTPALLPIATWLRIRASRFSSETANLHLLPLAAGELAHCPVCASRVTLPAVICPACSTPHHADCFTYNAGCGLYGCRRP